MFLHDVLTTLNPHLSQGALNIYKRIGAQLPEVEDEEEEDGEDEKPAGTGFSALFGKPKEGIATMSEREVREGQQEGGTVSNASTIDSHISLFLSSSLR